MCCAFAGVVVAGGGDISEPKPTAASAGRTWEEELPKSRIQDKE